VPDPKLAQFGDEKYLSLETLKKNGHGVKTPIWFVLHESAFYVYTEADSGKVKRIRNNPRVRVAVCNIRGDIKGPWFDATASLVEGDERLAADKLLDRKYFLKKVFDRKRRCIPDPFLAYCRDGLRGRLRDDVG
jgi:PPOX class probable F420-dependent enzyme